MKALWQLLRCGRRPDQLGYGGSVKVTPPAGLCEPCRELLVKRPATVLRAEGYSTEDKISEGAS